MNTQGDGRRSLLLKAAVGLVTSQVRHENAWFPGSVTGGLALIAGPALWLTALILRYAGLETSNLPADQRARLAAEPVAAPGQLVAYVENPGLVIAGYSTFAAACIIVSFAVITFGRVAAERSYHLAQLGAVAVVASLAARLYFLGVELTAFRLVDALGLEDATRFVMDSYVELSYGLSYVPVAASAGALLGGVLLSLGALRAGTIGAGRCVLLMSWAWTFLGVLKDSDGGSISGGVALCIVMVPLGVRVLGGRVSVLRTQAVPEPLDRRFPAWLW